MRVEDPTPEEIEDRTRQVREGGFVTRDGRALKPWSDKERSKRLVFRSTPEPWSVPEITMFPEDRIIILNDFSEDF